MGLSSAPMGKKEPQNPSGWKSLKPMNPTFPQQSTSPSAPSTLLFNPHHHNSNYSIFFPIPWEFWCFSPLPLSLWQPSTVGLEAQAGFLDPSLPLEAASGTSQSQRHRGTLHPERPLERAGPSLFIPKN